MQLWDIQLVREYPLGALESSGKRKQEGTACCAEKPERKVILLMSGAE